MRDWQRRRFNVWLFLVISLAILMLDQAVKRYISVNLEIGQVIRVLPGVLDLTHIENPGGAFGILAYQTQLFITLGAIFYLMVVFYLMRASLLDIRPVLGLAVLSGGVLGNLIDRVRQGYVTDYLHLHYWPVFNLADVFITAGAACLFLILMSGKKTSGRGTGSG